MSTGGIKAYGSISDVSYVAEGAIANLYRGLDLGTAANSVSVGTSNTVMMVGVNQTTAATLAPVTVRTAGFTLVYNSGGVTKGNYLTVTAAGAFEATTTAADLISAIAMETASTTEISMALLVIPSLRYDSF